LKTLLLEVATGKEYIMMEVRICAFFQFEKEYQINARFIGEALAACWEDLHTALSLLRPRKTPHLKSFKIFNCKTSFIVFLPPVLTDTYVKEESETGIIQQAPYFGEDEYRVWLKAGVITRDQKMICPVDDDAGRFIFLFQSLISLSRQLVKVNDTDKNIMKWLKDCRRMVKSSSFSCCCCQKFCSSLTKGNFGMNSVLLLLVFRLSSSRISA